MRWFSIFIIIVIWCLTSACQINKRVTSNTSISHAEMLFSQQVHVPMGEASVLNKAYKYNKHSSKILGIYPSTAELVNFGTFISPAKAVMLPENIEHLVIESYVTSASSGQMFLFYPVITAFDEEKNLIGLIKPRYEFNFEENVLQNQFFIPEKARYILIHTTPEFTGMSFTESNANFKRSLITSESVLIASSVVVGVPISLNTGTTTYLPEYSDFSLAIIGNIKLLETKENH
jgi:hypothetical protein